MRPQNIFLTGFTCLAITATPVMADVTGRMVWDDWKNILERYYADIDYGQEVFSSAGVTISGAKLRAAVEDGVVSIALPDLAFLNQSDGTVKVTMGQTASGAVTQIEPATSMNILFSADIQGFEGIVSGTPAQMTTDYSWDSAILNVDELGDGEITYNPKVEMALEGVTGQTTATTSAIRDIVQRFTIAKVGLTMDVDDPKSDDTYKFDASITDLTGSNEATLPKGVSLTDSVALIKSGFASRNALSYGPVRFDIDVVNQGQGFVADGGYASGSYSGAFAYDTVTMESESKGLTINARAAALPIPISLSMDSSNTALTMPIAPTDDPKDFALDLGLNGFAVSEVVWAMFDPAGQLPRDPANIEISLDGTANWLTDLFDEEAIADTILSDQSVGEIHSLTLKSLLIDMVGAKLMGEGAFTFDNDDLVTFDGMPKPTGVLNFHMTGANTLLDTLSNMGLLPAEQAMGVRMMMGLFTRPGDAPGSLTSTIEVTSEGQILANGQRIR
ncbi:DUF2125 domain-containing protein [Algirhabdus cladophorae]|uniref:DUF2125 domain-containing protein n=1 Tax=Algirhabdus cladophorae TaxID=3377108 RepID=UPI003B84AB37